MAAILGASLLGVAGLSPLRAAPAVPRPAPRRTGNVILITVDGFRIQEMFAGMDPVVSDKEKQSGIYDLERARSRFWRPTAEERRRALLPFFWGTLAPKGIVLGDKEKGSRVTVTNPLLFSAPGYAEILTGQPQPDVKSNDPIRYPHQTVLEFAQRELHLGRTAVATIGSWENFGLLSSSRPDLFFTNTGYEKVPDAIATPRMRWLSDMQYRIMALWEEGRSDAVTTGLALEYLKKYRPRLLYIALGESDDWAHARRYDRLLDYIRVFDDFLGDLWRTLESSDFYRGRTTLIITTDHGRGVRPSDWVEHDEGIEGSEDIWVAVIGPDTPDRGEVAPSPTVHQADVAATLLQFLGLDARKFNPNAGPPIPDTFTPSAF
ncbi:MAG TPA: alkaline phosphatase family protein [Candidatus Polarisedimenticolia bacterium]|nr:alkaline phosphatase family protein [Candidatus Polarisedimenticolia bacterium]